MPRIAYMGWLGHKNIGDEACYEEIVKLLPKNVEVVTWDAHQWKYKWLPNLLILGGGTIFDIRHDRRGKAMFNMLTKKVPLVIWGSGVAPLTAPKRPVQSAMHPRSLHILRQASFVGVRGPISQSNLASTGFNAAHVIGDPAILAMPTVPNISSTSKTVAVNFGDTHTNLFGSEEMVLQQIRVLLPKITACGYKVVLFPMWPADMKFICRIPKMDNVTIRSFDVSTQNLVDFFRSCYCVIGQKLHATVLAAAACVPFISLGYREKNFDFAESVDLPAWVVRTDHPQMADIVFRKFQHIKKYHQVIVLRLAEKKKLYQERHAQLSVRVARIL